MRVDVHIQESAVALLELVDIAEFLIAVAR